MSETILRTSFGYTIEPKTQGQSRIVQRADHNDVVFTLGPAGTGKTYVSLALAVAALRNGDTDNVILTRPAVQAGEDLGFLPGELHEKLDPYMAPFYGAMSDFLKPEEIHNLQENGQIRYEPLGFLRGQTLDDCYVILDEAQNATRSQLKMFLTRLGKKATAFITGDPEQTDLPRKSASALYDAEFLLRRINGVGFVNLDEDDIVRHRIVKEVISAYRNAAKPSDTDTEYQGPGSGLADHAEGYSA